MRKINNTKELTNYQRKKMEKKIAKQQAISQEQREETFSESKNEKTKNEKINQQPKRQHFPTDLDTFIRDNEKSNLKVKQLHHIKVELTFWQRLRVLFGANPTLAVAFNINQNKAENLGTIFN